MIYLGLVFSIAIGFPFFSNISFLEYANSLWPLVVLAASFCCFNHFFQLKIQKRHVLAAIFAGILSVFLMVGKDITAGRELNLISIRMFYSVIFGGVVLFYFLVWFWNCLNTANWKECFLLTGKKRWLSYVGLIVSFMLCWLPGWLANYPGTFEGDMYVQYLEYTQYTPSRAFPVFNTLFLGFFIELGRMITGSANAGIALCVFVQMLVMAIIFAYAVLWVARYCKTLVAVISVWLLYAFLPTIQMMSWYPTRDIMFSALMLASGFLFFSMLGDPENFLKSPWRFISAIILSFIAMNSRNVGVMVFVAIFFILVILLIIQCIKKSFQKYYVRILAFFAMLFLIQGVYQNVVLDRISVERSFTEGIAVPGIKESLSVPIQQIMRVANRRRDELTEEDISILSELISEDVLFHQYREDIADIPKYNFDQDRFRKNPKRYISEYISLGARFPKEYVDAFLILNHEAWYPDTVFDAYAGTFSTENYYLEYGTELPGSEESKIPSLFRWNEVLNREIFFSKIPLVSLLFSPAFMFYVILCSFFYAIFRKRIVDVVLFLPAFIVHIGCFFTPVSTIRYFALAFFSAPLALALLLAHNASEITTGERQ